MSDTLDESVAEINLQAGDPAFTPVEPCDLLLINDLHTALKKSEAENAKLRDDASPNGWKGIAQVATNENAGLHLENAKLRKALDELVWLKHMKDKEGKTLMYQERQPKAWDAARTALKDD